MDTYDYAQLSEHVYGRDPNNPIKEGMAVKLPSQNDKKFTEYEVIAVQENPENGYFGTAYRNTDTNEIIVTHRGTEPGNWTLNGTVSPQILEGMDLINNPATDPVANTVTDAAVAGNGHLPANKDFATNGGMLINNSNRQYPDAQALTERAIEYVENNPDKYPGQNANDHITQAGHSLGGNNAQLCAHNYNQRGVTFNAYGAGGLKEVDPNGSSDKITNHVMADDSVSSWNPNGHLGTVVPYATQEQTDLMQKMDEYKYSLLGGGPTNTLPFGSGSTHGMDNFIGSPEKTTTESNHVSYSTSYGFLKAEEHTVTIPGKESILLQEDAVENGQKFKEAYESYEEVWGEAFDQQGKFESYQDKPLQDSKQKMSSTSPGTVPEPSPEPKRESGQEPEPAAKSQNHSQPATAGKSSSASDAVKNMDMDDSAQVDALINGAASGKAAQDLTTEAQAQAQAMQPSQQTPAKNLSMPIQ